MTDNIYQSPGADLINADHSEATNGGSLETALLGEYSIGIGDIRREAWKLTKGNKGVIWLAVLVFGIVSFGANFGLGLLGLPDGQAEIEAGAWLHGYALTMSKGFLLLPVTAPLLAGFYLLCIKRVAGIPASVKELFAYFGKMPSLVIVSLLSTVLMYLGFALFILPGIYLLVAYAFAIPLMIDKNLSPWQAMEASRRAVTHRWFTIFGIGLLLYLITILSVFTIIGLIWTMPMYMIAYSLVYRTLFGVNGAVSDSTDIATEG